MGVGRDAGGVEQKRWSAGWLKIYPFCRAVRCSRRACTGVCGTHYVFEGLLCYQGWALPGPCRHAPTAPFSAAVQNVHFNYPARPALRVLSGLSLTVHPGEIVALVGPSGGGKSSIVKLVERFYMPSEGGACCAVLRRAAPAPELLQLQ